LIVFCLLVMLYWIGLPLAFFGSRVIYFGTVRNSKYTASIMLQQKRSVQWCSSSCCELSKLFGHVLDEDQLQSIRAEELIRWRKNNAEGLRM
jgi:hypothetical protein